MKSVPGTLQEGGVGFEPTHWSVVLLAASDSSPAAAQTALSDFCQTYWPPIYSFIRRRGYPSAEAQDLTQAFFAHLLERNTLSRASQDKGQLRTFLLGSLTHFLANEHDRARTLKRGGGMQFISMEEGLNETEAAMLVSGSSDASGVYDQRWAADLLNRAWEQLRIATAAEGNAKYFEALAPFVVGGSETPPDQETVAARLGAPITTFRNLLWRLRQRYREEIRREVARTVSGPSRIDEEMRHLLQVLLS